MKHKNLFEVLTQEREYQIEKFGCGRYLLSTDWAVLLIHLICELPEKWTTSTDDDAAFHQIRKIATSCIAAIENGAGKIDQHLTWEQAYDHVLDSGPLFETHCLTQTIIDLQTCAALLLNRSSHELRHVITKTCRICLSSMYFHGTLRRDPKVVAPQIIGKCYVAGGMRGIPEFNFPAFDAAAASLREEGYEVFNPAERDKATGFNPTGMTGNENLTELGFCLREALHADTEWICLHATHIYMLKGWERSSGARAEHALALALGLQVMYEH
jgi:hypothetical protein